LVFLDESGFSLTLSLPYGWGKRGEPLLELVPACRGKNLSVLAAIDLEGMVAQTSKEGAMTRADVERFFEVDLLPLLLPGSVLILDNAGYPPSG
jgi:hypothetical protein